MVEIHNNKKMGAIPKLTKYKIERNEVLNKIMEILGITDDNMKFYLWDLENSDTKKESIMELKDNISEYFTSKTSSIFRKADNETKRPYLSLIRLVFKQMGYEIVVTGKSIKRNDISFKTSAYLISLK